jgi:hypothetical protein
LGFGYHPAGAQPDLLENAGVIAPEDAVGDLLDEDEELSPAEQKRRAPGGRR